MTEEQKLQIRKLRQQGLGYQAIGKMVNLTRDSVRSYCKNHGLQGVRLAVEMNTKERIKNGEACAYCAGPIKKAKTGRPARFCCEACRRSYWKAHRDEGKKSEKATYTMECKYCHKIFESYGNKTRKYCCHAHYVLDRYGEYI
jgi:predicted transcriptional regulator|nr:MAG TPA: GcrA cell cycle regulator [Caudoviricetes sp.]